MKNIYSLLFITLLAYSCSPDLPIVPPINSTVTGESHPGKFVWYDLMTDDISSVKPFYAELFGWEYIETGEPGNDYTVVLHKGNPIAGMFELRDVKAEQRYSQWISYLSVDNMKFAIEYTKQNGGSIYREPFQLPNRGTIAFVFDSQNAVTAFVKSSSGDPKDEEPVLNDWLWTELWSNDIENSVSFYNGLLNYEYKKFKTKAENFYHVLEKESEPRAGIVKIPYEDVKPHWMPYIAVKDPSVIVDKVEPLGGKVLLSEEGVVGNTAAIIADPSGAVFTVQKWPLQKGAFEEVEDEK
ncbi:MAG: VOC family protein [Ignavibacteria bacterium]|nr:VOC family protein [Ignavibacteria bacterium]